ncbi:MAG: BF3164 family lipoprotein [Nitritalea sp.]
MKFNNLFENTLLFFVVIFFQCCNSKQEKFRFEITESYNDYKNIVDIEVTPIKGQVLELNNTLVRPRSINLSNDTLYVATNSEEDLIQIFTKDGIFITSFLKKGFGPNEAMSVMNFNKIKVNSFQNGFLIYDGMKNSVFTLNSGILSEFKMNKLFQGIIPFEDSLVISQNLDSNQRFSVINLKGEIIESFGNVLKHPASNNSFILNQAYFSYMDVGKSANLFISTSRLTDQIEIYDLTTKNLTRTIRGPKFYDPIFTEGMQNNNPIFIQNEKGRFSYIDVIFGEEYIYGLFSGYSREENPDKANSGEFLFVFDFNGVPVKVFKLDHTLLKFEIEESSYKIYGVDIKSYNEEKIIIFDLPL